MEQLITDALAHGGPTALAILAAGAFIGLLLFREDLIGGKRYVRELGVANAAAAEWKAIAVKATETVTTQAAQIKALTDSVEILTAVVQKRR
jgi:hypothetical protein